MNPLLSFILWQQFFALAIVTFFTKSLAGGKPWSSIYLVMATLYLLLAFFFISSLDLVFYTENFKRAKGITDVNTVENIKNSVEFWKLIFPVTSLGIGCSMIANYLSASKPKLV